MNRLLLALFMILASLHNLVAATPRSHHYRSARPRRISIYPAWMGLFELVTVSMNQPDEEKSVLGFLKKEQASNRNLLFASTDRDKLINAFNPDWTGAVPYTVLISPEGKIVYSEVGSIDPLAVKRAIQKALNERKPW